MEADQTEVLPAYTVGPDAYGAIPDVLGPLLGGPARLVVVGGETAMAKGVPRLEEALAGSEVTLVGCVPFGGECTHGNARKVAENDLVAQADVILAMGGGRAIDCAKEAAELASKPLMTAPTVASNCAPITAIGVFYREDGSADAYYFPAAPPLHCFIDLTVIADSPDDYFWAGIGDALSKEPEVELASRDVELAHTPLMGRALCHACGSPLFSFSEQALADKRAGQVTEALRQVVLDIIITTGLVSNMTTSMVGSETYYYNSSVAHAFYNAWTGISKELVERHLHGEVVSFGVMVLKAFDHDDAGLATHAQINRSLGLPVTLAQIGVTEEDIPGIVERAQRTNEWGRAPYPFTPERFEKAIREADAHGRLVGA